MIPSDTTQTIQTLILQREDIVVVSRNQHPVEKSSVAINMEPVAGPSTGNQAPTSPHITFSWLLTKQEQHLLIYVIWNFTYLCTPKILDACELKDSFEYGFKYNYFGPRFALN